MAAAGLFKQLFGELFSLGESGEKSFPLASHLLPVERAAAARVNSATVRRHWRFPSRRHSLAMLRARATFE